MSSIRDICLTREGSRLTLSLCYINGYSWPFTHERSTDADAANLLYLINQKMEADARSALDRLSSLSLRIGRLERSNNALRGVITKLKNGRS